MPLATRRFTLPVAVLAFAATAAAEETTLTIPPEPPGGTAYQRVRSLLPPHVGCAVMVLEKDRGGSPVVFKRGFGVRRVTTEEGRPPDPVTPATTFHVASFTKVLTAAAVLRLADEGKLGLDDPVVRWLPGLGPVYAAVTLRQMLDHTSGLPDYHGLVPENPMIDASDLTVLRALARANRPPSAPGDAVVYSNTAYVLLGLVVQQASGRPFADYLAEEVLRPAGMGGSVLLVEGLNDAPQRAFGHTSAATPQHLAIRQRIEQMQRIRGLQQQVPPAHLELFDRQIEMLRAQLPPVDAGELAWREEDQGTFTRLGGDGALYTSLDDLEALFAAVRDRRFPLSDKSYALWLEPRADPAPGDGFGDSQRGRRFACGWIIDERTGERRLSHRGATKGFRQTIQWFPESGRAVVVLMNSVPPGPEGPAGWDDALLEQLGERVLHAVLEADDEDALELTAPQDLRDAAP